MMSGSDDSIVKLAMTRVDAPGAGGTSGRVAELDSNLTLVAEHPRSEKTIDGFSGYRHFAQASMLLCFNSS